jgi:hypothetical protein
VTDAGGDPGEEIRTVLAEIEAEARAKRESGEYPPELERELDGLFEELVPDRVNERDFEAVLAKAERASLVDLQAPIDDPRPLFSQVKRGVQKLVLWYMEYVVRQLSTFAATTARAVRLLGERTAALEERTAAVERRFPEALDPGSLLAPEPLAPGQVEDIRALLGDVDGRVLHADAADGALVKELVGGGVDAYGVGALVAGEEPDLRTDDVLHHLERVGAGALGALVLSGGPDRLAPSARVRLAELAGALVAPGGVVVVVGTPPGSWEQVRSPVEIDLGGGRPFHPETWETLLRRCGFDAVEIRASESAYLVAARRPA